MAARGYANRTSVNPGDALKLSLSGDVEGDYALRVQQLGVGVIDQFSQSLKNQPEPSPADGRWEGYNWTSFEYAIPARWSNGLYRLEAKGPGESGYQGVLDFVVTARDPGR